jgi:hypothetical protein
VPLYPIGNLISTSPKDSGGGYETDLLTLGGEDGFILPVFTSINRFWAFVDVYLAGDDSIQPSTFPMDPFELAEKIERLEGAGELGFLVFNPTAVTSGQWSSVNDPIPVARYCRFMSEIRPGIQQAVRESVARFGSATPGSAAHKVAMEWLGPRIEWLAKSAGARVDEWWQRPGARE